MDKTDHSTGDLGALNAQRQSLRAFADRMLATLEAMPKPQSFIDIARALRVVMIADRALVQLYSLPKARSPSVSKQSQGYRPPAPEPDLPPKSAAQPRPAPLMAQADSPHISDWCPATPAVKTAAALQTLAFAAGSQLGLSPRPTALTPELRRLFSP